MVSNGIRHLIVIHFLRQLKGEAGVVDDSLVAERHVRSVVEVTEYNDDKEHDTRQKQSI